MATKSLFDDFSRLVTDATGAAQGMRREVETAVKGQIERVLRDMDVATREEMEVLRDLVTTLGQENAALKLRVAALEGGAAHDSAQPGATLVEPGAPRAEPGATPPGN